MTFNRLVSIGLASSLAARAVTGPPPCAFLNAEAYGVGDLPHTVAIACNPDDGKLVVTDRQCSEIVRLPSPTRIEDGAIEQHTVVITFRPDDTCGHFTGIRVC